MKRHDGFTLVELLVALAITVLLVVILTSVVASTLGAWTQGRNRLDTYSTARQTLGRMTDELKGAIASSNMSGGTIQFVENASLSAVPAPTPGTAENVFFVAHHPNLGGGDLCAIAYSLDSTTHQLKRAFRSSDQVWADGAGNRYHAAGHTYLASDWHVIATGVMQFELQCYSQNDLDTNVDPPAPTWDSESTTDSNMTGKLPRRIRIRLQVVDGRAVAQLSGLTEGSVPYNAILLRSARQFFSDLFVSTP